MSTVQPNSLFRIMFQSWCKWLQRLISLVENSIPKNETAFPFCRATFSLWNKEMVPLYPQRWPRCVSRSLARVLWPADSMTLLFRWRLENKKLSCCCDSRSYCVRRTVYWQTVKPVSVISLRTAGTHDPIQRVHIMNYLLKRTDRRTAWWCQWPIILCNTMIG